MSYELIESGRRRIEDYCSETGTNKPTFNFSSIPNKSKVEGGKEYV
jgi:hypothetical protein